MNESVTVASILYLGVYRALIIAVGALSIYLGYKLFIAGIGAEQGGEEAGIEASIGGTSFALKNAAPGTFFAIFGVIVIAVMLINAPAEVEYQKGKTADIDGKSELISGESIRIRGSDGDEDFANDQALATRLNNYAWDLSEKGQPENALTFAMLANRMQPQQANIIDSIAEFLFNLGRFEEALQYKNEAISIDNSLASDLNKYQQALKADD